MKQIITETLALETTVQSIELNLNVKVKKAELYYKSFMFTIALDDINKTEMDLHFSITKKGVSFSSLNNCVRVNNLVLSNMRSIESIANIIFKLTLTK